MKLADKLLEWYDEHGRDLPWRRTDDPYKIVVSEIMLHQTQVPRVLKFYDAWLDRFPDWEALAAASNADVIEAWAGLGYNRRALMLRDMARHVVEHGEPTERSGWQELKGIGPYTSAAVAAFAHKKRVLPIDTNIRRVLGRVILGKTYPTTDADNKIEGACNHILPSDGRHEDVPQALFDLATKHCTKTPNCTDCPLRQMCGAAEAFLSGDVEAPKRMTPKANETIHRNKKHPDRIYRGRILKLVREAKNGALPEEIGPEIDPRFTSKKDSDWLNNMINRLEKDGLIAKQNGRLVLPQ